MQDTTARINARPGFFIYLPGKKNTRNPAGGNRFFIQAVYKSQRVFVNYFTVSEIPFFNLQLLIMTFKNAINWFEIPATDLERASKFYETIFDCSLIPMDMPNNLRMRMFPVEEGTTGGALCHHPEFYKPSSDGPVLYLNGNPDLQLVLDRITDAGGTIIMPKTEIDPQIGYMAMFIDSEGNRIALHSSPKDK